MLETVDRVGVAGVAAFGGIEVVSATLQAASLDPGLAQLVAALVVACGAWLRDRQFNRWQVERAELLGALELERALLQERAADVENLERQLRGVLSSGDGSRNV